jgi:cytochrome b561
MAKAVSQAREATYSPTARRFHWWTFALLAIQVPLGFYMFYRAGVTNFDALTDTMYSTHKALGLVILALVVMRLLYRLVHGAPADEPTLERWQKVAAHATHWSLYLLLILVALLGWLGISLYGAREIFGLVSIPALAAPNREAADLVLNLHGLVANLILVLVGVHVGAAVVLHYLIRGDGVLARMLPWADRTGRPR